MVYNMQRALFQLVNQLRNTSTFFKNALTNYQKPLKQILDNPNNKTHITIDIENSNTNRLTTSTRASYNFEEINTNGKYPLCVYDPLFTIMLCIVFYSKDLVGIRSPNYTFYLKNEQNQTQNVEPATVAEQWNMFATQYNNELNKQQIKTQGSYENQTILTDQFRKICLTFLSLFSRNNGSGSHKEVIFNANDHIIQKGVHCASYPITDNLLTTEKNVEEFYKDVCQLFGVGCLVFSNCQPKITQLNNIQQKFTFGLQFQDITLQEYVGRAHTSNYGKLINKLDSLKQQFKNKTSQTFGYRELRLILAIKLPQPIPEPNQSQQLHSPTYLKTLPSQQPGIYSKTLHPTSSPFEQPSIQHQIQPNISQPPYTLYSSPISQNEFIKPISNIQSKNLQNVSGFPNPISKPDFHPKTNERYVKSVSDDEPPNIFNLASSSPQKFPPPFGGPLGVSSSKTVQQNQPQNKQSFVLSKPVSGSEIDDPCIEQIEKAVNKAVDNVTSDMNQIHNKKLQYQNDEIDNLKKENTNLQKQVSESKKFLQVCNGTNNQNIILTNENEKLKKEIETQKKEVEKVDELIGTNELLTKELKDCEATKNTLQTQLKEAQDKITSCESIQAENKRLIASIIDLKEQLEDKSKANSQHQETIDDLKLQIEKHETTIQKLQNEIKTLNTTNTNLKNKQTQLQQLLTKLQKMYQDSNNFNEQLQNQLKSLQSKHEQSLDELNKKLGNANVLKEERKDRIIELQNRFTKRRNKIQSTFGRRIAGLQNKIKNLETKKTKLEQTEQELRDQINVLNKTIKTYTSDDSKKDKTTLLNLQNQLNEAQETLKTTIETHKKTEQDLLKQKFDFENKVKSKYKTELEQQLAKIAEQEEAKQQKRQALRKKRQTTYTTNLEEAKQALKTVRSELSEQEVQAQEAHEKAKSELSEYEIQAQEKLAQAQKEHDLQQQQLETEISALRASRKQVILFQKYEACNRSYKNIDEINETIKALNHDLDNSISNFEISPENPTLNSFSILSNICCAAVQAQDFSLDKIQVPEQMFENLLQAKSLIGMDWCMGLRGLVLSNDFGGLVCNVDNLALYITKVIENGGFKGVYPGMTMFNATPNKLLQTILKSTQQPAYQLPQEGFFKEKIKKLFDVHKCCLKCILYDMLPIFPNLTLEHLLEYGLPINELPFSYVVLTAIYIEKRRIIITDELYNCVWVYADKPPPEQETKIIYININEESLKDQPILMTRTKSESTSLGYKMDKLKT